MRMCVGTYLSTQPTENMPLLTVLSEYSDICRFQQTNQTSLDVNELVFLLNLLSLGNLTVLCNKIRSKWYLSEENIL
jgi:hypothetical protein